MNTNNGLECEKIMEFDLSQKTTKHMKLKDVLKCKKNMFFWCQAKAKRKPGLNPLSYDLCQHETKIKISYNSISQLFTLKSSNDTDKPFNGLYEWNGSKLRIIKLW